MATRCFPLVRGRRLRATRLDGCGNPVLGPDSVVVTKGFISVALTANIDEGEEINVTNAGGEVCVLDSPIPKLLDYSVEITFCNVNPSLFTLMTGMPVVMNGDDIIGFDMDTEVDVSDSGFAIELWTGVPTDACEPGAGASYGYVLLPFLRSGVLGDFTVENAAINMVMSGARTKKGNNWGVGPFDVILDGGVPSPFAEPLGSGVQLRIIQTSVAPPADDCEPQPLGVEATGATAGTPGTYTPANSYGPLDLAELTASGITATPGTAWTTGQFITLRDGSTANWNGTAWEAGVA